MSATTEQLCKMLAEAMLDNERLAERLAGVVARRFGQLSQAQLAAFLDVSVATVRRSETLQRLARDIPDVGRRWSLDEVNAWCRAQGRAKGEAPEPTETVYEVDGLEYDNLEAAVFAAEAAD